MSAQPVKMFGWRFYRIHQDRLVSPYSPNPVELPRDGLLKDAFFFMERGTVWSMSQIYRAVMANVANTSWDIAVTYGVARGPLRQDPYPDWRRNGSLQCASYQSFVILTNAPGNLTASYDLLPVIKSLNPDVLAKVERIVKRHA